MPPSRVAFIKYSTEEGTSCSTTAKDHSLFHLAVEAATPGNSMTSIFFILTPLSGSMSEELLSVMWMVPKHIQGADHGIPSQGYRQTLLFSSVAMITSRGMISKMVWICIAISQHIDFIPRTLGDCWVLDIEALLSGVCGVFWDEIWIRCEHHEDTILSTQYTAIGQLSSFGHSGGRLGHHAILEPNSRFVVQEPGTPVLHI